jgi:hypothetical protein
MGDDIEAVKSHASTIIARVKAIAPDSRIGLMDYRDFPSRTKDERDFPYRDVQPFTADVDAVKVAINGLSLGHGGDGPETRNCALMHASPLTGVPGSGRIQRSARGGRSS